MSGVWARERFVPGGRRGRVRFLVFLDTPAEGAVDLVSEGWVRPDMPPGVGAAVATRPLDDETEAFLEGFFAWLGDHPEAARIRAAPWIVAVEGEVEDPPDLGHLQAGWAAVRWVCRRGAIGVWDVEASVWRDADEVLAAPAESPRLACTWGVHVFDGGEFSVVHTLGMVKFGRRDLLVLAAPGAEEDVARLLEWLGEIQAEGLRLDAGDRLERDGLRIVLEGYNPGFNAPPLDIGFPDQPLLLAIEQA